ncbi:hypothetical protein XA68_18274 [Ophiocordyceps unilateralis]|uniref:Zn(2)-C6 fungal-type domain-containing protein n=1 Tax=Ophiocordyceps unilateralis TaxID=268505 RepID=A0A2A9P1V2_OPHUN|nr:hypothetical protein XA68_18274 [Ophiocordyceps unilateralis]
MSTILPATCSTVCNRRRQMKMPRRVQIRMACQRCRHKRAKCDGRAPCKRCNEAGELCFYDSNQRETKDELRAEIKRLKRRNEENDRILQAVFTTGGVEASDATTIHNPEGWSKQDDVVVVQPRDEVGDPAVCARCQARLPMTPVSSPAGSAGSEMSVSLWSPLSLDGAHNSHMDMWTRTQWSVAAVRKLLDDLHTWDYFPYCLLQRDLFLRDYHSGSTRFCSSALVYALLSMAMRVVNENGKDVESPGPDWSGSKAFFDEAEAMIRTIETPGSLPDVQALGILSLYRASCGDDDGAQELADLFATNAADLCAQGEPGTTDEKGEEYLKAQAMTYCGAVSLTRLLRLTTVRLPGLAAPYNLPDEFIVLDITIDDDETSVTAPDFLDNRTLQLLPMKLFQLTEWVYKLLSTSASKDGRFNTRGLFAVYTKCLNWYESIFSLKTEGSDTPFVLFTHIYYQYCLLSLFRPFAHLSLSDSDIQPQEIYLQAAKSIIELAKSYRNMFSLRRVCSFIPCFVYAVGVAGLPTPFSCDGAAPLNAQPRSSRRTTVDGDRVQPRRDFSRVSTVEETILAQVAELQAQMGWPKPTNSGDRQSRL